MDEELRERREKTWNMLVVRGFDYSKVVSRLADEYDMSEGGIKSDIHRMDDWLPKLDDISYQSGVSRLRELRENRQRLQQMALQARKDDDLEQELKIRRQIDKAVQTDIQLSQSLGHADREEDGVDNLADAIKKTAEQRAADD